MILSELKAYQRVSAIEKVLVEKTSQGWALRVTVTKIGTETLYNNANKPKLFQSLDTVYSFLNSVGVDAMTVGKPVASLLRDWGSMFGADSEFEELGFKDDMLSIGSVRHE